MHYCEKLSKLQPFQIIIFISELLRLNYGGCVFFKISTDFKEAAKAGSRRYLQKKSVHFQILEKSCRAGKFM